MFVKTKGQEDSDDEASSVDGHFGRRRKQKKFKKERDDYSKCF